MQHVRRHPVAGFVHFEKQPVDDLGAARFGPVQKVRVQDLVSHHVDVLMGLQGLTDVHGHIRRRYHLHPRDPTVYDVQWKVDQVGLEPTLREGLGGGLWNEAVPVRSAVTQ
jgi:hypothetical protein